MNNSDWIEVQSEVAAEITVRECRSRGIKCWKASRGEQSFTDRAQDIFNNFYDEVDAIMEDVLGPRSDEFIGGFEDVKVSSAKRRRLVSELSEHAGFNVGKLVGDLS